jgi:hypothetical protein
MLIIGAAWGAPVLACAAETTATVAATATSAGNAASYSSAFALLGLFVFIAALIATRKVPAMVALPVMAFGIGLIAQIPVFGEKGILATILEGSTTPSPSGAFMLYKAIIYTLLGGMFARFINDARIAERIIKYAAEYGGENPFLVALTMSAITALIFTAIGGLPAIIMLGTVMFPVLLSLGVAPATVGGMLLLAFPIGSALAPSNWAIRASQYNVDETTVRTYFLIWAGIQAAVLLAFLSIEFLRTKRSTVTAGSIARSIAAILAIVLPLLLVCFAGELKTAVPQLAQAVDRFVETRDNLWSYVHGLLRWVIWAGLLAAVVHSQVQYRLSGRLTAHWNMITPVLPLLFILLLGFKNAYGPAFIAALAFGYLTTPRDRAMQRLGRAIMDGVGDVAAPVVLMLGIGMLVAAAMHPSVDAVLTPVLAKVIPTKPLTYVLFFLIASPLALYRGPLNEWGLGVGIARLLANFMPAAATMGAIQSVSMLQDPTTTQNVWVCGFLKLDINALLFKLFFYSLSLCVAGLILSAYMFFG